MRHDRRTTRRAVMVLLGAFLMCAGTLAAQNEVRSRLEARGLPADLVQQISAIAADATAQGLPAGPLADKAIEGFAKQVPPARIVAAVRQFNARMLEARGAVHDAGIASPGGEVVTAAAEALGRGIQPGGVGRLVRAAPASDLAASGLTVAAALSAQGMAPSRAVDVVSSALQKGRSATQILDLPSVARAMQSRGLTADEAGQQMLGGAPPADGRGPGPGPDGERPGGSGRPGGMDGRPGPGMGTPPPPPRDGRPPRPGGGNSGPGGHPGMP